MRRSLFIIAMTLCLLFAMSTGIFAADYTDVKDSDWFIKDLNEATDAGIAKRDTRTTHSDPMRRLPERKW